MKSNKLLTQQQQQETEQIPAELIEKFDHDKQLVQEFLDQGYTVTELQNSTITHPTKFDPVVTLDTNHIAGFYINKPNEQKWRDDSRTYNNRTNRFF